MEYQFLDQINDLLYFYEGNKATSIKLSLGMAKEKKYAGTFLKDLNNYLRSKGTTLILLSYYSWLILLDNKLHAKCRTNYHESETQIT